MIRGRRAHGAFSDTGDMRHCHQTTKQGTHNISARFHCALEGLSPPLTPKTLKMSAYGTLSPTARPPRVLPTPWALPTPAFATWQGCRGKPPAPLPQALGRLQPVKAKPQAVASQALTGFQLHPLRIVLLLSRRWRGVKGGEAVHLPLTPWSRPNTSPQGQVVGF